MTLTSAFAATKVALDRSMSEIAKLLERRGVREHRYTHLRPIDPAKSTGDEAIGTLRLEFAWPRHEGAVGVRIDVTYQPLVRGARGPKNGTTAQMAARALFWFIKAKFDSIDYGIEEFEVAFMPHLLTAGGYTFAERAPLVLERMQLAEADMRLALPSPEPA